MKIITILTMLVFIIKCDTKSLPIVGTWISKEDKLYVIKFDKNMFYEIYDNEISSYKYLRDSKSCDKSYLDENEVNLDFISLDDGRCFEITSLSDSILVYRHTSSGKLLAFYKKNE